jgi:hypothetical protein
MAVQAYRQAGFQLRSRTTIWTDPVRERSKTNADRLLHKSIGENSRVVGTGMPEYILVMRKDSRGGKTGEAVMHAIDTHRQLSVEQQAKGIAKEHAERLLRAGIIAGVSVDLLDALAAMCEFPVDKWSQWASPVWMKNATSGVLNAKIARSEKDERHLTPTPLAYLERLIELYSNPGDVVFDPFSGIGSTGYQSVKMLRKFIGSELKPEYAVQAAKFLAEAEASIGNLFGEAF